MTTPPAVRPATLPDVPAVAATLAAAFADNPWTAWTVDERDRDRRLTELYALFTRVALASGEVWVTDDLGAAAAWRPPGAGDDPGADEVAIAALLGDRAAAAGEAEALVAPRRPTAPHWYLATLGTRPDRRGQGLGTAVLRPVLDRADADGVGTALETSAPRNLDFYARLGFAITDEVAIPGGPPVWLLWRAPGGA